MKVEEVNISENQKRLFWEKVDKSGDCWIWIASTTPDGYGKFTVRNGRKTRTFRSSRVAYILTYGYIDDNLLACHKCDNVLCVNPEHIFLGSIKDNYDDSISKERQVRSRGESLSKLKNEDVFKIRDLVRSGTPQIQVAKMFHVGKNCVWHIVNHTTWRHL